MRLQQSVIIIYAIALPLDKVYIVHCSWLLITIIMHAYNNNHVVLALWPEHSHDSSAGLGCGRGGGVACMQGYRLLERRV